MELISQSVTFSISKRKRRSVDDTSGQDEEVDTVTASDKRLNTFITYNERHQALIVRQVRKRLVLTFPHSQHFLKDDRLVRTLCDFFPGVGGGGGEGDFSGVFLVGEYPPVRVRVPKS